MRSRSNATHALLGTLCSWQRWTTPRSPKIFRMAERRASSPLWVETPLDEVSQQGLGHTAVLRVAFPKAQNLLLPLEIDAQGDQQSGGDSHRRPDLGSWLGHWASTSFPENLPVSKRPF
jgi:hypothetical protein